MSTIFALPVRLSMMFDGFMSPWTIPSRCSAARAARHSRTIGIGDARLEPRLHRPGGHDHVVHVLPAAIAHPLARALEHLARQQPAQIVAVDPLHLHDADAVAIDEVVHVQQVVLLDLGHAGGDLGDAAPSPRRSRGRRRSGSGEKIFRATGSVKLSVPRRSLR